MTSLTNVHINWTFPDPSYIHNQSQISALLRLNFFFRRFVAKSCNKRVSQMKMLNTIYLVIYWTKSYTTTSFFYVVSIACYFIHCYATIFLHDGFNCCNDPLISLLGAPDQVEESLLQF